MTTDEKYGILLRAANLVVARTDRAALLAHHQRISSVIKDMLMSRKSRGTNPSGVTKDNPTGNPFKYLRKAAPTVVSSKQDRSLDARRAASDVPDTAFD